MGTLLEANQPDVLIGSLRIMGTGHILTRGTVVIMTEPMYHPSLYREDPKRGHRLGQPDEIRRYIIHANKTIEVMGEQKRGDSVGVLEAGIHHCR